MTHQPSHTSAILTVVHPLPPLILSYQYLYNFLHLHYSCLTVTTLPYRHTHWFTYIHFHSVLPTYVEPHSHSLSLIHTRIPYIRSVSPIYVLPYSYSLWPTFAPSDLHSPCSDITHIHLAPATFDLTSPIFTQHQPHSPSTHTLDASSNFILLSHLIIKLHRWCDVSSHQRNSSFYLYSTKYNAFNTTRSLLLRWCELVSE